MLRLSAALRIEKLVKRFGAHLAIDHVSLDVEAGEVVSLLGPSGCGKTTTLRCIAGFYAPDDGQIEVGGRLIASRDRSIPPEERRLAMVFQNYVLWPHMHSFDNIAYGLRLRKVPRAEIERRVRDVMAQLGLIGLGERYPHALSGGQQQRVSVARSLVVDPDILLLDEPFSNLDAKLRIDMREEMRTLLKRLGTTAIYVTHDQEEAMALSDRIFLMDAGRLVQSGTPMDLFERPNSALSARFFGVSNIFPATIISDGGDLKVQLDGIPVCLAAPSLLPSWNGSRNVLAGFRADDVEVSPVPDDDGTSAQVLGRSYLGGHVQLTLDVAGHRVVTHVPGSSALGWPDAVTVRFPPTKLVLLPADAAP